MKNKIKNNILVILFILIIFCCINSKVFANSSDLNILDVPDDVLQNFYNLDEYKSGDYYYTFRYNNSHFSVLFISKEDYPELKQYISNGIDNYGNYRIYFNTPNSSVVGNLYDYSNNSFVKNNATSHGYFDTNFINDGVYICSNIDIYTDNTFSTIFFPQPPATLEEIMEQEMEQKATIQEILGILPMMMITLVSLLALSKGLKTLVNFLRQS